MPAVDNSVQLEPGAGASTDPGLGCPTIKVEATLSRHVGVIEGELPPGGGFQIPHWHEDLDEILHVLEGEIEYLLAGEWGLAPAGSTVFVPASTVHAFRNSGDRIARQLVMGPVEVAELIAELGQYPRERWEEVHERHRSHYAHTRPGQSPRS